MLGVSKLAVLFLHKPKQPLMACGGRRERLVLDRGRTILCRLYPFTIRLKGRIARGVQPARVKLGPPAIEIADLQRGVFL
jgi:hypothetical protein